MHISLNLLSPFESHLLYIICFKFYIYTPSRCSRSFLMEAALETTKCMVITGCQISTAISQSYTLGLNFSLDISCFTYITYLSVFVPPFVIWTLSKQDHQWCPPQNIYMNQNKGWDDVGEWRHGAIWQGASNLQIYYYIGVLKVLTTLIVVT